MEIKAFINKSKQGFTLIELLTVIAIIGILTGVVFVSTQGAVAKSKRASALTTASSVLPELVMCADDNGNVNNPSEGGEICDADGHTVTWPVISSKTGWTYVNSHSGSVTTGNYAFTVNKPSGSTLDNITCNMATNECT